MSYDLWKTTDPREYEWVEEVGPTELEAVYEELAAANKRIEELEGLLRVAVQNCEDVNSWLGRHLAILLTARTGS